MVFEPSVLFHPAPQLGGGGIDDIVQMFQYFYLMMKIIVKCNGDEYNVPLKLQLLQSHIQFQNLWTKMTILRYGLRV